MQPWPWVTREDRGTESQGAGCGTQNAGDGFRTPCGADVLLMVVGTMPERIISGLLSESDEPVLVRVIIESSSESDGPGLRRLRLIADFRPQTGVSKFQDHKCFGTRACVCA